MEEVDIFHPLATIKCKKCSSLPEAMRSCQAVYHNGTVYVADLLGAHRHEHRIYDYSVAKNVWNIFPTSAKRFTLAKFNDEMKLVKTSNGEMLDIVPLATGEENIHEAYTHHPGSIMTAMGSTDMLLVADQNLKVFLSEMNKKEFTLPDPVFGNLRLRDRDAISRRDMYFSIAFDNDCLFLIPVDIYSGYYRFNNIFCTPLNTIKWNQSADNQKLSTQLIGDSSGKQPRPTNEEDENTYLSESSELPNETTSEPTITRPSDKPYNDHDKETECLEWRQLPLPYKQQYSNLAVFGKRVIIVAIGEFSNVSILAYSSKTESWLEVVDAGDSIHDLGQTNIVALDPNQLMLLGGFHTSGTSVRDVYQMFLAVAPYDQKSLISLRALYKLEAGERAIKVLTRLKPKIRNFREKVQINEICAYRYETACPIVDVYIKSWLDDPNCVLKPTWENFLNILKEIELGDIAEEISTYLTSTSPAVAAPTAEARGHYAAVEEATLKEGSEEVSLEVGMAEQSEKRDFGSTNPTQEEFSKLQTGVSVLQATVKQLAEEIKELQSKLESHDEQFRGYQVKFAAVYGSYSTSGSEPVVHGLPVPALLAGSTNDMEGSLSKNYPDGLHSEPSFRDFHCEVATKIPDQWKEIGYALGFNEELEEIENKIDKDKEKLLKVFRLWSKQGGYGGVRDYKWIGLLDALKSIKEYRLAQELLQRLTPKDSSQKAVVPLSS